MEGRHCDKFSHRDCRLSLCAARGSCLYYGTILLTQENLKDQVGQAKTPQ